MEHALLQFKRFGRIQTNGLDMLPSMEETEQSLEQKSFHSNFRPKNTAMIM